MVNYNVQSLRNKTYLIRPEFLSFDVICLTETWLNNGISDDGYNLTVYNVYRRDRTGDRYGGNCVYVNKELYSRRRLDIEIQNMEGIWIEVSNQHKRYTVR